MLTTKPPSSAQLDIKNPSKQSEFRGIGIDGKNECSNYHNQGVADSATQDELANRAAAMLPNDILDQNEIIVLLAKPSVLSMIVAPLGTLVSLVVLTIIAASINGKYNLGIERQALILLGAGLIVLRIFWQFLEWLTQVYVLTDRRIICAKGILKTSVHEAPLVKITNVRVNRSFREKIFGLGTVICAVSGTEFWQSAWTMLGLPDDVREKIGETIQRYTGK